MGSGQKITDWFGDKLVDPKLGGRWKNWVAGLLLLLLVDVGLGWYWSWEPDVFEVAPAAGKTVTGELTTATLIKVSKTLLEKPGGYLSNDMLPHRLWLDNMPNWEFGALVQVRDMARAMRRDMSRSQSQSQEDPDLAIAEPQFNFDNESWAMPASESEYRRGIRALEDYLMRLRDNNQADAQFYARADNLYYWLGEVQNRLGSLSLRLSNSVGRDQLNVDLAGDSAAKQSTPAPAEMGIKTPWLKVDDIFYESRGACWALIHMLKAAEVDFAEVLKKKNAQVSFRQVVRELESTQEAVWSPMILNGSGFGMLANHSLVMANYISRANAAIIDLRQLLQQG